MPGGLGPWLYHESTNAPFTAVSCSALEGRGLVFRHLPLHDVAPWSFTPLDDMKKGRSWPRAVEGGRSCFPLFKSDSVPTSCPRGLVTGMDDWVSWVRRRLRAYGAGGMQSMRHHISSRRSDHTGTGNAWSCSAHYGLQSGEALLFTRQAILTYRNVTAEPRH